MLSLVRILIIGYLMTFSSLLAAQAVAQDVLDEVVISKNDYTGIIKIIFRVPVRYISHNPLTMGKEIRIKVDLLNRKDSRAGVGADVIERESLIPRYKESYGLEEVLYEKSSGDEYVTLFFSEKVSFEIVQGSSYRSISIIVHNLK